MLTNLKRSKIKNTAFADDLTFIVSSNSEKHPKAKLHTAIEVVKQWRRNAGLRLKRARY